MCVGYTGDDATNILTVSPRSPTFAFFLDYVFHEELSEPMFILLVHPRHLRATIRFISITMDGLVRVSERKGEKVHLYSAHECLTNYRREIARSY